MPSSPSPPPSTHPPSPPPSPPSPPSSSSSPPLQRLNNRKNDKQETTQYKTKDIRRQAQNHRHKTTHTKQHPSLNTQIGGNPNLAEVDLSALKEAENVSVRLTLFSCLFIPCFLFVLLP